MMSHVRHWGPRLAPVALLAVAAVILWRELHGLTVAQVTAEIVDWGPGRLAAAAGFALSSYALLAAMEWVGLRWAGAQVPFRTVLMGSFCANAFAHTIGFALLVGGAVRARLYGRHGATLAMVGQTSVFCSVSFGLGIVVLAGLTLVSRPDLPIAALNLHPLLGRVLGIALLAVVVGYVLACGVVRGRVRIAGRDMSLPTPVMAIWQVLLGLVDNAVTAAVVWALLPDTGVGFPTFIGAYVAATVAGLVSSVPGGAGVFEGIMLAMLPTVSRASLTAAFLGYRLIYYIGPLVVAGAMLAAHGMAPGFKLARPIAVWRAVAAPVSAAAAFALGAVLILTAVGRIAPDRLAVLRDTVPLGVLETSHLLSLVSGLVLMGASLGLFRRRARAVWIAAAAALVGASTALLRGLDIGPAISAAALAAGLLLSRDSFPRRGAWRGDHLAPWWVFGVLAVVFGAAALGAWVYDDTPYEGRLWAQVGYHADPSRFLRSLAFLGAALLAVGSWTLARAGGPRADLADAAQLAAIRPLVEASPDTTARLALTGDKALLRSEDDSAFIMYGAEGRSLIAMGDPVGDREAARKLLWRFKEMADGADARVVIYHASPAWLTDYLDLGLSLLKMGEEARVQLSDFSLAGGRRRNLRQTHAKAVREGLSFEIVQPPVADDLLRELQVISDAWLLEHGGQEKGYSLGSFDPELLRREPIALVRMEGRIVGFANVWTGGREEASVDLMRHLPGAAHGVMDFMFVEMIGWAQAQGFKWFNLGMAPLSGLADHRLAPLWHRIGAEFARRGNRFYGFEGLWAFKAKFDPVWTPRYLAAPPASIAAAIVDVTRLIARPPRLTNP